MTTDEKIRSLINPRLREIHANIQPVLNMGDLAVYVGQPMQDAMTELAEFVKEADQALILQLVEALTTAYKSLDDLEDALDDQIYPEQVKEDFNAADDREYAVNLTAKQYRWLGKSLTTIDTALKLARERTP